jgi:polyphosphate kinase
MQPSNVVTEPVVLPIGEATQVAAPTPVPTPAPVDPAAVPAPVPPSGDGSGEVLSEPVAKINLRAPEYYLNRELTWLAFNRRVLAEAQDRRTPLLERVKFAAIVASTLDEFFMKRIGGLKQQVGAGVTTRTVDGRTPSEQITACYDTIRQTLEQLAQTVDHLARLLRGHDVQIRSYAELDAKDKAELRAYYLRNIFPLVTPQAIDPAHPFPFVSNLSLNLLVTVQYRDEEETSLCRIKVPIGRGIPRFLRLGNNNWFVPLEEVMAQNLDLLFPGMNVVSCDLFRVTRNANTERAEESADDLLVMIETELRDRKFAPIVRLEVAKGMNPLLRGMVAAEFGLDEHADVFEVGGMMGLSDLFELAALDMPTLHDPPHHPVDSPRLIDDRSIFHVIREAPVLLQHPYESFSTSIERFLREAAEDPKVLAIKMTLYRTARESRIIPHLISAAANGKQVAVVVELKARFDEEANIKWAARMEEAGIHVTYGVVGLKTHCKTILVVRRDYDGLRRYCHVGTGNYNEETSRLYSDLGLLTCDETIGQDLTELFNYLTTGYSPQRAYKKLLPAPKTLNRALVQMIEREITLHDPERPGHIQIKVNALEDSDITRALYKAAQVGVKVDLVVRDTCRVRPGIPGLSEKVTVVSIVGRFLEHARIFYFQNGGNPEYYIGSADCMERNLKSRVELMVPIEDPALREQLRAILDTQLGDQRSAWEMQSDGTYQQRQPGSEAAKGEKKPSQQQLIELAERRFKLATRLRKRKPKGVSSPDRDL